MDPPDTALIAASARLSPEPTPWRSAVIHGAALVLWVLAFSGAFIFHGVLAWSTGLVYVGYDTALLLFVTWQTFGLLSLPKRAMPRQLRPSVGVVIAAYNEATLLPGTLAALLGQADPPDQIIIADDGSTDPTATLLEQRYGLKAPAPGEISAPSTLYPSLSWLCLEHRGKARALNAVIARIETDILLTVDADTMLAPGATGAMRRAFAAEPELAAATGIIVPICGNTLSARLFQWFQTYEYIRNFLSRYAWMRIDSLLLISGAFAGFRRNALLAAGGFDPDCLAEDYELIHRMRRYAMRHGLPWRTRVLGDATARTDAPGTVPAFIRQRRRWFGGFLQTQYWYREMVGEPRYGLLGTLMLPIKAVDTLQPLYGLAAFGLLIHYLMIGRFGVLVPVVGVMGGKIVLDLAFHLWSVHLYRRWVSDGTAARFGHALLVVLADPFTFQILRHAGAACGWLIFLTGYGSWGIQRRTDPVRLQDEAAAGR